MIRLYRIHGSSMRPTLLDGDVTVICRKLPKTEQIALARQASRTVVKRVERIEAKKYYLVGDNRNESTDSRHYGFVEPGDILGTVMVTFPRAGEPPKLVKPYGVWFGRIAALILVVLVLAQLYRIDTFIPILDSVLFDGTSTATTAALAIISSELFAIPFALRMRLSLLAQLITGSLVVLAPLGWVLIALGTLGSKDSIGQLGEFVPVMSDSVTLTLNLIWLTFSYVTLYLLGYNRLKVRDMLRKHI